MRVGDQRPGSLANLYAFARDNREERKNPRLSRQERAQLILETMGLRRRMRIRVARFAAYGSPAPVSRTQRGAHHGRT